MSSPDLDNSSTNDSDITMTRTSRFWRNVIAIAMMPFLILGIPVLSIVFGQRPTEERHITLLTWIKHVMSDRHFNAVNALCLLIAMAVNIWFFYMIIDLFYHIFILGQLTDQVFSTIRELFEAFPVLILIDFLWWRGWRLGEVIRMMNNTKWTPGQPQIVPNTVILADTLLVCVLINLIPYLSFKWMLDSDLTLTTDDDYYTHLPYSIINTMIFPLYIVLCLAVHSRNKMMNEFTRSLFRDSRKLDLSILREIKNQFKCNGQLIRHINAVFNMTMSIYLLYFMKTVLLDLTLSLPTYASKLFTMVYGHYLKNNHVKINNTIWPEDQDTFDDAPTVRVIAANIMVLLLKFKLVWIVLWQMHNINHESRAAPIMLNDLVTQFDRIIHEDLDHAVSD